jgi:lipopolysaccharide transport system permease protein
MIKHIIHILNPVPGLQTVWNARNLLVHLIKRNISVRYKGSMLGIFWSIVQPLMMLCIYTYVFSVVFKARWGESVGSSKGAFAIILFCGMALYSVFSESITLSSTQIISNVNFVKKVVFPLQLLPLAQVMASFLLGGIWLILLLFGAVCIFGNISWSMLLLPLVLIPFFLFTLGVSFFVSSLTVYVRDVPHVLNVILQIFFFLTPIFYPVSAVPENFRKFLMLNPLTYMIEQTRMVLLYAQIPDWRFAAVSIGAGVVTFILGFGWFNKTQKGFADVI